MIAQLRSAPAWRLAAVLGIAGIALGALAPPADHSIVAGIVAIVLLIGLAVALYNRPDGEGWAIFSVLLVPSLALQLVGWSVLIEALLYFAVATLLCWAMFERRRVHTSALRASGAAP